MNNALYYTNHMMCLHPQDVPHPHDVPISQSKAPIVPFQVQHTSWQRDTYSPPHKPLQTNYSGCITRQTVWSLTYLKCSEECFKGERATLHMPNPVRSIRSRHNRPVKQSVLGHGSDLSVAANWGQQTWLHR